MDAVAGSPLPPGNAWFALAGGTLCSLYTSVNGSLDQVVVSAAVGAVISYLTGYLLRHVFEKKRK